MIKIEDYPLSRVPQDKRVSFLSVAIVHMGMLTALDQFMLGAVLGNSMSLTDAFTAILIGSVIFGVVTYGLGLAGMREGISGSLLARWCGFGRLGSVLIGVVVAVSLLGWFGIQMLFCQILGLCTRPQAGLWLGRRPIRQLPHHIGRIWFQSFAHCSQNRRADVYSAGRLYILSCFIWP